MNRIDRATEGYHYSIWESVREYDVEDIRDDIDEPVFEIEIRTLFAVEIALRNEFRKSYE